MSGSCTNQLIYGLIILSDQIDPLSSCPLTSLLTNNHDVFKVITNVLGGMKAFEINHGLTSPNVGSIASEVEILSQPGQGE